MLYSLARRNQRGKKGGDNQETEFVRGFEAERCACQYSRWDQVIYYREWCGFSVGFLLRSLYIPMAHLVLYVEQMLSLDWSGAVP